MTIGDKVRPMRKRLHLTVPILLSMYIWILGVINLEAKFTGKLFQQADLIRNVMFYKNV